MGARGVLQILILSPRNRGTRCASNTGPESRHGGAKCDGLDTREHRERCAAVLQRLVLSPRAVKAWERQVRCRRRTGAQAVVRNSRAGPKSSIPLTRQQPGGDAQQPPPPPMHGSGSARNGRLRPRFRVRPRPLRRAAAAAAAPALLAVAPPPTTRPRGRPVLFHVHHVQVHHGRVPRPVRHATPRLGLLFK